MTTAEMLKNMISSQTWGKKKKKCLGNDNAAQQIHLSIYFPTQKCNKTGKSNITFQIMGKRKKGDQVNILLLYMQPMQAKQTKDGRKGYSVSDVLCSMAGKWH